MMDVKHISLSHVHEHPLALLIQDESSPASAAKGGSRCSACEGGVDRATPTYVCASGCNKFYLHKKCAEEIEELGPELVNHPLHPLHPLILLPKAPYYSGMFFCNFCRGWFSGLVYHCDSCEFDLNVHCAGLLQSLDDYKLLQHPAHQHALIFVSETHNKQHHGSCSGCAKDFPTGGSVYRCMDCNPLFQLHKECAELPLEINHPLDRKHPLTLLHTPPLHPQGCSCYICRLGWKGFVYYCHDCELGVIPKEDASLLPVITDPNHEHPWILLSRIMSFVCDFCGNDGDRTPYLCTSCNLMVHRDCIISLPHGNHGIRITRHHHPIFHSYFVPASQLLEITPVCRICHKQVNTGFGSYHCLSCNYIVHVKCATDENVWDGSTVVAAGNYEGESSNGESAGNLITDVIRTGCVRGEEMAIEIKHEYHSHNLLLHNFDGVVDVDDDDDDDDDDRIIICDGCIKPISNTSPFYACDDQSCRSSSRFFLHKTCAELPRNLRHPSHKHPLSLINEVPGLFAICSACNRFHHGFKYSCRDCSWFNIDIQCSSLSETLMHASHQHPLFLIYNAQGNCSGCSKELFLGYICTHHDQGCNFILDFWCLTLPQMARFKYEKHPVTLTYHDVSDPNQCFCDLCEEERDPHQWFYSCVDCNTTLHLKCALGDLPFAKAGRTTIFSSHYPHHPLTVVKKIWNCPPCNLCNKLCYGNVLECKESECNFVRHLYCHWHEELMSTSNLTGLAVMSPKSISFMERIVYLDALKDRQEWP